MPVQLGQTSGLAQFTPELQERMFRMGVDGIDITNGLPRREPNPEYVERMKTLENVYNMVQNGELVPRENVVYQAPVQQPVVQHAPVQVQNEPVAQSTQTEPTDEFMKMLFPENNVVNNQQQVTQQVAPVLNEQPKINWDEVVIEQQNLLRNEAVKQGIRGEEVMQWMGQLTPQDYVELYKTLNRQAMQQPVQQPVRQNNSSLINWNNNTQTQQYVPSIADMPGANVTTVRQNDARPAHPFGLR